MRFDGTGVVIPSGASQHILLPFLASISKAFGRGGTRLAALSLLTAAIWCWQHDRLAWANWSVPLDYKGDSLEILARIQAAAEGDLVPFGSRCFKKCSSTQINCQRSHVNTANDHNFGNNLKRNCTHRTGTF